MKRTCHNDDIIIDLRSIKYSLIEIFFNLPCVGIFSFSQNVGLIEKHVHFLPRDDII